MKEKILATFRTDPDKWETFKTQASEDNSSATSVLLDFIDWYLDGNRIQKGKSKTVKTQQSRLDNLDERIEALITERIEATLKERLQESTAYLANGLNERLDAVYTELEELRGKLSA